MAEPEGDEVLDALAAVVEVFDRSARQAEAVHERARELREGRLRGTSYAELMTGAHAPLVTDTMSDLLDGLTDTGSRLRRAEARALHAEGLSMDKISRILRVSRQRVSAIINSPFGERRRGPATDRRRSMGLSLTDPEFRMVAESLPHIAWVATPDGATEYFNRLGSEYTGVPPATNYAWDWLTLVHPDDQDRARSGWEDATRAETPFELDYRIRRFDGEFRWHRLRSVPSRGSDGRVVKWVGTATDIDDQKRLEEELRGAGREASERLALLDALYASAPIGFGLIDTESRVLRMNERLAAFNGAPLEDQLGRTVAELVPELWPQLEPALRRVRETGDAVISLHVTSPPDRHGRTGAGWLASSYPVRSDGEMIGIGIVVVDR
jgi:PAS domain S-box-containing protein